MELEEDSSRAGSMSESTCLELSVMIFYDLCLYFFSFDRLGTAIKQGIVTYFEYDSRQASTSRTASILNLHLELY